MGLMLFSGNSWKTLHYLELCVWNIGGTSECLFVEERSKTTWVFSKIIFLIEFFLEESVQVHQGSVTFMKFMYFPNDHHVYKWAGESGGDGQGGSSVCWSWRHLKLLCPSLVIPEEDQGMCSTRSGQTFEKLLLLPAEAQLLSLHVNHCNMKGKCINFSDNQCLLHREQHLFRVSTYWHRTGNVLGHCSSRVTVTRDEGI